ncbi:MAG TPA: hypothetical protein VFV30_03775, partial [Novosphingobium sp.]|nr:hypothetical protein [Novosphingobium sp.]
MAPAQGPGPVLQDRLAAFALVALAVGAGLAAFWLGGAPAAYLPVNAAALALAAAAFLIPGERASPVLRTLILIAAPLLIGATFLIGPEVLGVHRWIALGPLLLHPGSLLLPALVTVAALQSDRAALAVVAVCAGLVWL